MPGNDPANAPASVRDDFLSLARQIRRALNSLAAVGCRGFDCQPGSLEILAEWGQIRTAEEDLPKIRSDLGDCRRCRLAENRAHIVFGSGAAGARLMFVGEAPGFHEDQQGEPFVGAAGQLLTRIIRSIGLERDQVYICNVIKCRPPQNRDPLADEIDACLPFLQRQIRAVQPQFICALGKFAAQTLLGTQRPISKLRGKFHDCCGVKLLPTFHPSFLLHNPQRKRDVWEDMKLLMRAMEDRG